MTLTNEQTTKNLLITGAKGQVGSKLAAFAHEFGFTPIALTRGQLDITNPQNIADAKQAFEPAAVINAAAYTAVDKAEEEEDKADRINRLGPTYLADAFDDETPLIHFSTDYVFDGQSKMPYTEDTPTTPLNVYGRTKRDGELPILARPSGSVIRISWVYSDHGSNFLKTMIRVGRKLGDLKVVNDQYGAPTRADEIARAALLMARKQLDDRNTPAGLYHYAAGGQTTWHGFAETIFKALERQAGDEVNLSEIPTSEYPTPAARPTYSVMSAKKIQNIFGVTVKPWDAPVSDTVSAVLKQKENNA